MANVATVANFDINILNPIFDYVLTGVKEADREEVKHDSIVRILTALSDGKIQKDIFNFSHTVIQRTVFDYYRKKTRKITTNSTLVNFNDGADEEVGSTVEFFSYETDEQGYGIAEVRIDYLNNIDKFTKQEQKVIDFMLFTEEGMDMSLTEISNQLGVHKSHATRAMQKLKKVCQA
jgi:RNA polymerase sigma factor (sigma-70 family)